MRRILSPTTNDGRPVCVEFEKKSVFTLTHYLEGSDKWYPPADFSRRVETGLFRVQKRIRLYNYFEYQRSAL